MCMSTEATTQVMEEDVVVWALLLLGSEML